MEVIEIFSFLLPSIQIINKFSILITNYLSNH